MQRGRFFGSFFIFLLVCLILILVGKITILEPVNSIVRALFAPISAATFNVVNGTSNFLYSSKIKSLQEENQVLTKKIIDQNKLLQDNKALRDQFLVTFPKPTSLIEADIVGAPSFVPGFSTPQVFVIDRGEKDGVKVGDAVVYKESLIGKITKVSSFVSNVVLVNNSSLSVIGKTLATGAQGVVRGEGGENIILNEVLLSDSLKVGDIVLTKGDISLEGVGIPPNLIIGKIASISKNASDLFQKAEIKSEIDFSKIDKVFVLIKL